MEPVLEKAEPAPLPTTNAVEGEMHNKKVSMPTKAILLRFLIMNKQMNARTAAVVGE